MKFNLSFENIALNRDYSFHWAHRCRIDTHDTIVNGFDFKKIKQIVVVKALSWDFRDEKNLYTYLFNSYSIS